MSKSTEHQRKLITAGNFLAENQYEETAERLMLMVTPKMTTKDVEDKSTQDCWQKQLEISQKAMEDLLNFNLFTKEFIHELLGVNENREFRKKFNDRT